MLRGVVEQVSPRLLVRAGGLLHEASSTVAVQVGDRVVLGDVGEPSAPDLVVVGPDHRLPVTSTDNRVVRFDGTGGALQGSGVTIDDSSRVVIPGAHPGLKVGDGTTHGTVQVSGAAGSFSSLQLLKGGLTRWTLRRNGVTESGSNAGSNLEILRYGDTETLLSTLTINRATGKITLPDVGSTAGLEFTTSGPRDMSGSGSPEGVVGAPVGSTWRRTDGGTGTTFYVKETGSTGNTGWVAK